MVELVGPLVVSSQAALKAAADSVEHDAKRRRLHRAELFESNASAAAVVERQRR